MIAQTRKIVKMFSLFAYTHPLEQYVFQTGGGETGAELLYGDNPDSKIHGIGGFALNTLFCELQKIPAALSFERNGIGRTLAIPFDISRIALTKFRQDID